MSLTDEELVAAFEAGTLAEEDFHHDNHLRAAFIYLTRYSLPQVLERFSSFLLRLAEIYGKSERYHETVTWAYVFTIHERMLRNNVKDWNTFAKANQDLLTGGRELLLRYYPVEMLDSDLARKYFILPRKIESGATVE